MELSKLEKMKEIKVKLEDIRNSQASLIEKIAKVLVELFNTPDADLEKQLNTLHSNASDNADLARDVVDEYENKIGIESFK